MGSLLRGDWRHGSWQLRLLGGVLLLTAVASWHAVSAHPSDHRVGHYGVDHVTLFLSDLQDGYSIYWWSYNTNRDLTSERRWTMASIKRMGRIVGLQKLFSAPEKSDVCCIFVDTVEFRTPQQAAAATRRYFAEDYRDDSRKYWDFKHEGFIVSRFHADVLNYTKRFTNGGILLVSSSYLSVGRYFINVETTFKPYYMSYPRMESENSSFVYMVASRADKWS